MAAPSSDRWQPGIEANEQLPVQVRMPDCIRDELSANTSPSQIEAATAVAAAAAAVNVEAKEHCHAQLPISVPCALRPAAVQHTPC